MKTEKQVKEALVGLDAAYDIAKTQGIYSTFEHWKEALQWVLGE